MPRRKASKSARRGPGRIGAGLAYDAVATRQGARLNYYWHHLGDYLRDTSHLSMLEDAAYRRLLDAYYVRERPLPPDLKECCRFARATSKPERDAVAYVLGEFFKLTDDGYHQTRADLEIAKFHAKSGKAKEAAEARWNACERNANASAEHVNGNANALRTHNGSISECNAIPITNNHKPRKDKTQNVTSGGPPTTDPDWLAEFKNLYPERGGDPNWRGAMRAGRARIAEGHTPDEFLDGARRYQDFCRQTGKLGTEFVKQASTFLGPGKPFLLAWDLPNTKADTRLAGNLSAAEEFMRRTEPKH